MNTKLTPEQINLILSLLGIAIGVTALILALSNLNTAREQVTLASEQIKISIDQFSEQQQKEIELTKKNHRALIVALTRELEGNLSFTNNFLQNPAYYAEDENSPMLVIGGRMSTLILEEALRSNSIADDELLFSLWKTFFAINEVNGMIEDLRSKSYIVPIAYQQLQVLGSLETFSGPLMIDSHEKLIKYLERLDENKS